MKDKKTKKDNIYIYYKYRKTEMLVAFFVALAIALTLLTIFIINLIRKNAEFGYIGFVIIFLSVSIFMLHERKIAIRQLKRISENSNESSEPEYSFKKTRVEIVSLVGLAILLLIAFGCLFVGTIINMPIFILAFILLFTLSVLYLPVVQNLNNKYRIKKILNNANAIQATAIVVWSQIFYGIKRKNYPVKQAKTCKRYFGTHILVDIDGKILKAISAGNISYAENEKVAVKYLEQLDYCVIM